MSLSSADPFTVSFQIVENQCEGEVLGNSQLLALEIKGRRGDWTSEAAIRYPQDIPDAQAQPGSRPGVSPPKFPAVRAA